MSDDLDLAREAIDELLRTMPVLREWALRELHSAPTTTEGAIVIDAAGEGWIKLGPPSLEHSWDVRRIDVSPQDPTVETAATLIAFVYRGGTDDDHPMMFVDRTRTTLPVVGWWDEGQFTLRPGEPLHVRFTGATAGERMFASIQAIERPTDQVPERRKSFRRRKGIMRAVS